jgi:hypothetical protein
MTLAVPIKTLTLEQLALQIKPSIEAMDRAEESKLPYANQAGRWLKLAKETCGKGAWSGWVERNFNRTKQMADAYIRIHDHWAEIEAETAKTGKAMTISGAIDFIKRQHPEYQKSEDKKPKKRKEVKLQWWQKQKLQSYLTEKGLQVDALTFAELLADLDVNVERLVDNGGVLDALLKQIKDAKIKEWLGSFKDGGAAWRDACNIWEFDPQDVTAADAAAQAKLGVFKWCHWWWGVENNKPGEEYDTIIDGIEGQYYYLVNGSTFNPDETARKVVAWIVSQEKPDRFVKDEQTLAVMREKLAALPKPPDATAAEQPATPTDLGPADAQPPNEEPGTPSPRRRRR